MVHRSSASSVQFVIVVNLVLYLPHRLDFVGQLGGVHELLIDLSEIHLGQVETSKFLDRESTTLLALGGAPWLTELNASLLLQYPAQFAFEAAIFAFSDWPPNITIPTVANIPMITITIINSMRVKAFFCISFFELTIVPL